MNKFFKTALVALITLGFTACNSLEEIQSGKTPQSSISEYNVFRNETIKDMSSLYDSIISTSESVVQLKANEFSIANIICPMFYRYQDAESPEFQSLLEPHSDFSKDDSTQLVEYTTKMHNAYLKADDLCEDLSYYLREKDYEDDNFAQWDEQSTELIELIENYFATDDQLKDLISQLEDEFPVEFNTDNPIENALFKMNNNLETAEEMIDELDRLIELDSDLAGTEAMITDFRKQTESDQENPPKLENSQPIYENFYREIGRDFIDRYEDTIKAYEENGSESQEFYSKYERMISAYNRAVSSYNSFNQVVIYQ